MSIHFNNKDDLAAIKLYAIFLLTFTILQLLLGNIGKNVLLGTST